MDKIEFLPVLIGSDINAYSMARTFHEAYGIQSLMVARDQSGHVKHSRLSHYIEEKELNKTEVFLSTMRKVHKEYGKKKLLIIGCSDYYVRLIAENKKELQTMFVVPYADQEVMDHLILKESFYNLCEQYHLDYAKTFVYKPSMNFEFTLNFDFPVVLKPSDTVTYIENAFPNQHKVYFIDTMPQLLDTLKEIYRHGYKDNMIIQERIDGDDDSIYDLHVYVGSDHKVKLMSFGNVILEEHTPKVIGSNAATLLDYNEELMKKVQVLLEGIGYEGFADCDIKYDQRDGTYKMFEINIRQGRSHYRVTGAGDNLAKYVVEDYIYHKPQTLKLVKTDHFWHVIPLPLIYKYTKNQEKLAKIKKLVKEKKVSHSLYYNKDLGLKRRYYLALRDFNQVRKFSKYL